MFPAGLVRVTNPPDTRRSDRSTRLGVRPGVRSVLMAWAVPAVTGTSVCVHRRHEGRHRGADRRRSPPHRPGALGARSRDVDWFTGRVSFLGVAALNVIHHGFPFVALSVLAGLPTIPDDIIASAVVDGASAWQRPGRSPGR